MIKAFILGVFTFMLSFFVASSVVHGQTATPSPSTVVSPVPSTSPSPTTSAGVGGTSTTTTVPKAAPATGFGE